MSVGDWTLANLVSAILLPLLSIVTATVVSIALVRRKDRQDAEAAVFERRRVAIERCITAMSKILQEAILLPFISTGLSHMAALKAMMLLYLDVPLDELAVARWVELQSVQLIESAQAFQRLPLPRRRDRMATKAGEIGSALVLWHKGQRDRRWFEEQLSEIDPHWVPAPVS